jgi:cation-transporting ATPase E
MQLLGAAPVERQGLDDKAVQERVACGQVNVAREPTNRSFGDILKANLLTRFNLLLGPLCLIILLIGPPQDALFGIVLVINSAIGIVEEVRAKYSLDRLAVLATATVYVWRNGALRSLAPHEIVRDDVIELRPGEQVPVDGVLRSGCGLEIDESLLTGESRPVCKGCGNDLLSGTVVMAGTGRMQAIRVGPEAYGVALAVEARKFALARSELRDGINRILSYVTWLLPPTALLLIVSQLVGRSTAWDEALRVSVAGVVGMVPEGLVLLTSIALAAAIVRLGHSHLLVQDLPAVELLARGCDLFR